VIQFAPVAIGEVYSGLARRQWSGWVVRAASAMRFSEA